MKDSTVYQMIIERGIEQGRQLGIIGSITDLLDRRLRMSTAEVLTPLLEPIDDLQTLKQLFHEAIEVEHLEDFIRTIQNI